MSVLTSPAVCGTAAGARAHAARGEVLCVHCAEVEWVMRLEHERRLPVPVVERDLITEAIALLAALLEEDHRARARARADARRAA